jgi:hypothetical protein
MITIIHSSGSGVTTRIFPPTVKGNRESVKYIEQLHENKKNQPWYFLLDKIVKIQSKLDDHYLGLRTKKRLSLEADLKILQREREDYLKIQDIAKAPPVDKIQIINNL